MGQYWKLLNLDKRQSTNDLGKLGECLFDGTPKRLSYWLNIPTSPGRLGENPLLRPQNLGCWAGDRIICLGDYNACYDYPTGLLTDYELQEIQNYQRGKKMESSSDEENYSDEEEEGPDGLYGLSKDHYTAAPRTSYFMGLEDDDDNLFVLRNISKGVYVRADRIRPNSLSRYPGHPGFGEIVMSRISWSTDDSISMCYDISRGIWAGDRFDIRTIDSVEGGEWKDVSDEVAKEISDIWESEYGSEWEGIRGVSLS